MNMFSNFLCDIQYTEEFARTQVNQDEDSYDEESASQLEFEIGSSRQEVDINDWSELEENYPNYEPVSDYDREQYYDYLERKEYEDEDEDY